MKTGLRAMGVLLLALGMASACSGKAVDDEDDGAGNQAHEDAAAAGHAGASSGFLGIGDASGPLFTPNFGGSGNSVAVLDAGDAGCNPSPPHTCDDLGHYLEQAGDPDGGVDIELGDGDLTLLVIFDKSGSMAAPWDLRTRWQAASDAMIAGFAPYLDNLTIGAILFPKLSECAVLPFDDAAQIAFVPGRQFISEWVEDACLNQPEGATPMQLAFEVADQALNDAGTLGLLADRFRVLVVTDGEPNCETEPELLPGFAQRWHDELGVETWVIGLPGSEGAGALMDAIAEAGGTEQYQHTGDPCTLQGTLDVLAR